MLKTLAIANYRSLRDFRLEQLIRQAAERTQVLVVSHSLPLIEALNRDPRCQHHPLEKNGGETQIAGQDPLINRPSWQWMQR